MIIYSWWKRCYEYNLDAKHQKLRWKILQYTVASKDDINIIEIIIYHKFCFYNCKIFYLFLIRKVILSQK